MKQNLNILFPVSQVWGSTELPRATFGASKTWGTKMMKKHAKQESTSTFELAKKN